MPQNAIIRADGTGDYVTLSAWAIAERTSNYGAPTRCYIDGVVASSAVVLFHTATSGWPNGAELYALTGQDFDGTNLSTCAAITHTTGPIDIGNVDVDIQGLLIDVTGGYNNKNIKFASSVSTTKRRKITLKNLALRSSPNYHGATCALDLGLNSTNLNNQYDVDIADVIIIPRANNAAFSMTAVSGTLDISGTVKNITILPSNSGSTVKTGFYLGVGSACTVEINSVLSLGSEARPAYVDYENLGLGGTATNIVTKDGTGTITGRTTTTELENYAAGDYRLKTSGLGFGAFPVPDGGDSVNSDISAGVPFFGVSVNQSADAPEYQSYISAGVPLFSAAVSQSSAIPYYSSVVSMGVPLFSVASSQQQIAEGSSAIAFNVPLFGVSANQESTIPEFISVVQFGVPMFSVSAQQESEIPSRGATVSFSVPLFCVSVNQESTAPQYDSAISFGVPFFSVAILSGEFDYHASPDAVVDIPSLSRQVDMPNLSMQVDIPSLSRRIDI